MILPARAWLSIPAAALLAGCSLFFGYPDRLESDADGEDTDADGPDHADTEPDPDPSDPDAPEDDAGEDPVEEETAPFCGDGEPNGTEECDDANDTPGDGCEDDCTYSCTVANQEADCNDDELCTDNICNGSTHVCSNPPVTEGTTCIDGEDCTYPDTCNDAGTCVGTPIDPCQDTWIVRLDLNQTDAMQTSIIEAAGGGYVVVGSSSDTGPGGEDMWIAKLAPVGSVLWQKAMGGTGTDYAADVIETSDGSLVVAGASGSWTYPFPDDINQLSGYMVKLRPDGSVLWQRVLGGMDLDEIRAVTETSTGSIAFAGYIDGGSSSQRVWAGVMDTDGNLEWHAGYGAGHTAEGLSIIETSDGNLLVAAMGVDNDDGFYSGWFLKLDVDDGTLLWSKEIALSMINVRLYDAVENPATDGILFAGADGNSNASFLVGELAAGGTGLTWTNVISPENQNRAVNVILESSGGLLLSGATGSGRHWSARLNGRSGGAGLVWHKQIGVTGDTYQTRPGALVETADHNVVMSAWTQPGGGPWDLVVINLNAAANVDGTCGQVNDFGYSPSSGGPALGDITGLAWAARTNVTKSPSGSSVDTAIPLSFVCPE